MVLRGGGWRNYTNLLTSSQNLKVCMKKIQITSNNTFTNFSRGAYLQFTHTSNHQCKGSDSTRSVECPPAKSSGCKQHRVLMWFSLISERSVVAPGGDCQAYVEPDPTEEREKCAASQEQHFGARRGLVAGRGWRGGTAIFHGGSTCSS